MILRLRVPIHIRIRVHPLQIALCLVHREEDAGHRVIVARDVVVQPRQAIVVLPGKTLGGVDGPGISAKD